MAGPGPESLAGRELGAYRLERLIGTGGMGEVYRAFDPRLDRVVAVKILPLAWGGDAQRRARFQREARAIAALNHPHICTIHDVGQDQELDFLVLEWLEGEPLSARLARGPLPIEQAVDVGLQIADALDSAHRHGIVHRDLKPGNVMLTQADGKSRMPQAKLLDFGLARMLPVADEAESPPTTTAMTAAGAVLGTPQYMAPEQIEGKPADARTDIFALGALLYEMVTGRRAFEGESSPVVMAAILRADAPSIASVMPAVPRALERLVRTCLEKDPAHRISTMHDVVFQLRGISEELDARSPTPAAAAAPPARRRYAITAAALAIVLAGAAVAWQVWRAPSLAPIGEDGRPSIAVLYFENHTGRPELDWLRRGLTDLLVTNLSQIAGTSVLTTDRLHGILAHQGRQDEPVLSFDTVQEVARLANARTVLTGSYLRAGDTIRINVTLRDAASGRTLSTDTADAVDEARLFQTVDELTRRLRPRLTAASALVQATPGGDATPSSALSGRYRDLKEVTTTSIDAYRLYIEAVDLMMTGDQRGAERLLDRAIDIDPDFALALSRMAVVQNNLRRPERRQEYARRALDRSDRLTLRDRYFLEAVYYSGRTEESERAFAAFEQLLALDPQHYMGRLMLAFTSLNHERVDDTVRLLEPMRQDPLLGVANLQNLAWAYGSQDRFEESRSVLEDAVRRFPSSAGPYRGLANLYLRFGRLDEASRTLHQAASLEPAHPDLILPRWTLAVLQQQWVEADRAAADAIGSADRQPQTIGMYLHSLNGLYRGRSEEALRLAAGGTDASSSPARAAARPLVAYVSVLLARPEIATGSDIDPNDETAAASRWVSAIALSRLGRSGEARPHLDWLAARSSIDPRSRRRWHAANGMLAFDRKDVAAAVRELGQAESLLVPRGHPLTLSPDHGAIWYQLGVAYLAAGDDVEAARRFERLVTRVERALYPVEAVRSLYFLGEIAERRGDLPKAREYFRQFLHHWGNGTLDPDRIARARRLIAAHGPTVDVCVRGAHVADIENVVQF